MQFFGGLPTRNHTKWNCLNWIAGARNPKYSNTPKVLHTRRYARHWAVHTSVSTTASDYKVRWYSEKIHTGIVVTNTSGHYPIQVPRPPKSEWISWRKQVSTASSQATIVGTSSSSATRPKPRPYLKGSVKMLSSHIVSIRRSTYR